MAHLKLSEELKQALDTTQGRLSIGLLLDRVGEKGFGLLLLILSLPSALPIPAAGYSIPFGILLSVLALQMLAGREQPVFTEKMRARTISSKMADRMVGSTAWLFSKLEWLVKPRMRWVQLRQGRRFMGLIVLLMAMLMMIPIPSTNTAPAAVIFLIGIGLSEEDGFFAIAACVVGMLAIALYAALIWAIIYYGPEIAVEIKDTIKSWLGLSAGA